MIVKIIVGTAIAFVCIIVVLLGVAFYVFDYKSNPKRKGRLF